MSATGNRLGHTLFLFGTDLAAAELPFQLSLFTGSSFSQEFLLGGIKKGPISSSSSRYYFVHLEGEKNYPSAVLDENYLFLFAV